MGGLAAVRSTHRGCGQHDRTSAAVKERRASADTDLMSAHTPRLSRTQRTAVAACLGLLVVITILRLAVSNPVEAVGFLYVIPISLLASELGLRGGMAAAVGAIVCTVFWALLQDVPLGVIGYGARALTFLGVGVFVGLQSHSRLKLEREREGLLAELQATATHDQLTGLPNRRAWDDRLEQALRRAASSGQPLSVLAIDLDRLKHVNATHGHQDGDRLLKRCAHAWNGALRGGDYLARLGGDEFLVLLPGSGEAAAAEVAQRVLGAVPFNQTCSVGIATWDGEEPAYELVHRADQGMYAAKAAGGGRVDAGPVRA
jgi:diguanylate cyclase (GGDEF)-like protein